MNAPLIAPARHRRMLRGDEIIEFVTGGKSTFTIKNMKTGNRATYRVDAEGEEDERVYVVSAFTGANNEDRKNNYTVLGVMDADGLWRPRTKLSRIEEVEAAVIKAGKQGWIRRFILSVKARVAHEHPLTERQEVILDQEARRWKIDDHVDCPVKRHAFPWMWWRIVDKGLVLPADIEVWHEGNCRRCRRKLTVPASIELGLGPNCATEVGKGEEWTRLNILLGHDLEAYGQSLAKLAA
jgi:hypothetical protein